MTIELSTGNVGSGKTAHKVYELLKSRRTTYTNIYFKKQIPWINKLSGDCIIKSEKTGERKKRDGTIEPIITKRLNMEFWENLEKPFDAVFDEIGTIFKARRAMSKTNIIFSDFLAAIRKLTETADHTDSEITFITQLSGNADVILRRMAHRVTHHICHYIRICPKCGMWYGHTSDDPEKTRKCTECGNIYLKDRNHKIEILKFDSVDAFSAWEYSRDERLAYRHYFLKDISKIFKYYDTYQTVNLFEGYY